MGNRYFTPEFFDFLARLAANNDREWFKQHQDEYEKLVREPALDFISDIAAPLRAVSEHFVADPRKVGGSLFRIQRDTRFGADKTPYKENTGVQFRHASAKDVHSPGFYMNLQPDECYMGAGIWRPESKVAYTVRGHIADKPAVWTKATTGKRFTEVFTLGGDSLSRAPKGYTEDHALIDHLKRKDFIASTHLSETQVTTDHFLDDFIANCRRAAPFVSFLCSAVGVPF